MTNEIILPTLLVKTALAEFRLRCTAAAWSDQYGASTGRYSSERPGLVLLSAVGPDTSVKAIRAVLYSPDIGADIQFEEQDSIRHLARPIFDGKPVGFAASVSKLAPGAVHLVALAKVNGLMPCLGDSQLWAELSGPRYTTPILRQWVGWLKRSMIEDGKIILADGYGTQGVGILAIDPDELDEIVSNGVRRGYLKMTE